jgi:hypothetical protein
VTAGGPTPGQQWFIVPGTSSSNGAATGSYRLINRYSGLALGLSATSGRLSETTPTRAWTNTTGSTVGGSRTAAEQTLAMTAVGTVANLNGPHTISTSGKALDDPDRSTVAGVQLITWALHGDQNQVWQFTQQADGSYQLVNGSSGLCADDNEGSTASGAAVIQYQCTGAANQHWNLAQLPAGTYTLTNVHSGLLLTTASTSDGALVTQTADTSSALQRWTIS